MNPVKRLEIIVSSREMHIVLDQLDAAGDQGYSVMRDIIGKGNGGRVSDEFDFAATTLSNVYILSFCTEAQIDPILEWLTPLLKKFGGVCYVSDSLKV